MKNMIKQIRTWLVIIYANYQYKRNVRIADRLNQKYHTRYYVALDFNRRSLFVLSRKDFRDIKKELHPSNKDSILKLKEGAYYYTGNAIGTDTMPPLVKESRRLAFIKLILEKSRNREE